MCSRGGTLTTSFGVIALHDPRRHECRLISPESRSEWRDRNAKTEGRAEGKIKGGGTRRPWNRGLHRGWRGTRQMRPRAAARLATS
jgi:hypothetical protein